VSVRLDFDWTRLGIADPAAYVVRAPQVTGLQQAAVHVPGDAIPVPAAQGLFLILEPR
jgi:hypothetical protein